MNKKEEEDLITTIQLSKTCRLALMKFGITGETYEDILWKLMKNKKE